MRTAAAARAHCCCSSRAQLLQLVHTAAAACAHSCCYLCAQLLPLAAAARAHSCCGSHTLLLRLAHTAAAARTHCCCRSRAPLCGGFYYVSCFLLLLQQLCLVTNALHRHKRIVRTMYSLSLLPQYTTHVALLPHALVLSVCPHSLLTLEIRKKDS